MSRVKNDFFDLSELDAKVALRAGEPRGPVGIETLTQSPELLTNAKAAAQNDRHLSFFLPFFVRGCP